VAFCVFATASCAPGRPALPSGAGTPFPAFADAYAEASAGCAGVRTFSATTQLSGRAGRQKLRSRIDAGLEAPDGVVLEGIVFGRTVFVLSARGNDSTLYLPRDARVLRGAAPADIIEALAGVRLEPGELRTILAGCGPAPAAASDGRSYGHGWVAGTTGAATTFLREIAGQWRVVAATRPPLTVQYTDFQSGRAATVHLLTASGSGDAAADLTLKLSDVEINAPIDAAAFRLVVPPGAVPLTLDELRRAGPLGAAETRPTK
jgi:outer membrane lipoprotein-sorting protein